MMLRAISRVAGVCLLVCTLLATALSATPATVSSETPKLQFASTVYDFGKVKAGEIVRADFVFTNVGSRILEIKEVRSTCGCTTVGAWERQIAPGKSGDIPLQLDTAGFSGQVAKFVRVICNDPAQSFVSLQIKGAVWKAIDVTPSFVIFDIATNISSNEVRTVKITSNLEQPLELSLPQVSAPFFRAEIVIVRPGKEFDLRIAPVTPLPTRRVSASITLKTSVTNLPVIGVTALTIMRPPVKGTPTQ